MRNEITDGYTSPGGVIPEEQRFNRRPAAISAANVSLNPREAV